MHEFPLNSYNLFYNRKGCKFVLQFPGRVQYPCYPDFIFESAVKWITGYFNISGDKINEWITKIKTDGLNNSGVYIGQTIGTISGISASVTIFVRRLKTSS